MDPTPMQAMLTDINAVVSQITTTVGSVCTTIVGQPLLLMTTGFLFLGGAIGIVGRMLSKR